MTQNVQLQEPQTENNAPTESQNPAQTEPANTEVASEVVEAAPSQESQEAANTTTTEEKKEEKEPAPKTEQKNEEPQSEPKVEPKQDNNQSAPSAPVQQHMDKDAPQPQQQRKQSTSGWGSWGGWLAAASTIVTQSVEDYVKPTMSTLSETTAQIVKDLVSEEPANPADKQAQPAPNAEQNEANNSNNQNNNAEATDESEKIFEAVDKGLTFLGESVDYLGSYLNKGINKVAQVDINDIQNKAMLVATSSIEKGFQVGEKLATTSVDALEIVGKTALNLLTVKEEVTDSKSRIRPVFYYIPQMTKEEEDTFEQLLNRNYFEVYSGVAHAQSLESLSIESTLHVQKTEQRLNAKQREALSALVVKLKELYENEDDENEDENNNEKKDEQKQLPKIKLNEPAARQLETLEGLFTEYMERSSKLLELFKQDVSELKPTDGEQNSISSVEICQLTASYLDKALLESVRYFGQISAGSVELLLRIVESYLIDLDTTDGIDAETAQSKSTYVMLTASSLVEKLQALSNAYINLVKLLKQDANDTFTEFAKKGEAELEESKRCADDIETKTNLHINQILHASSGALSNVQDCKKFVFPVCKSMLLASVTSSSHADPTSS